MRSLAMVGRAGELSELVDAWSGVVGGGCRPVVLTGPAGVGKTLLVATALDAFRPRPAAILAGRARVHTPAPYDWLAAVLSARPGTDLPVPADALAWLAQHPDTPRERYAPGALLRLAVRAVRALVADRPTVLVVEDLHALDPASLNLVGELVAARDLPVLLVATSRPADTALAPVLVARTLARLAGAPGAVRQHLGPLGVAEVAAMLHQVWPDAVPPDVVPAVWARTGGNPYWLTELLAAAEGRGPAALVDVPLPEHLRLSGARAAADVELTARELEVLRCLAAGMSNKQVARRLDISIRTVTVHVSNLLRKTRSTSRTEVALWAVRHRRLPES